MHITVLRAYNQHYSYPPRSDFWRARKRLSRHTPNYVIRTKVMKHHNTAATANSKSVHR